MKQFNIIFVFYVIELAVTVRSMERLFQFTKMSVEYCGPKRLGDSWNSKSKLNCAVQCKERYSINCHGFLYNKDSQWCTAVSGLSPYSKPPNATEGDLYFIDSCDSYPDFSFFMEIYLGLFTNPSNYTSARKICECLNGQLIVLDYLDKLVKFQTLVVGNVNRVWIGLDDIVSLGNFVWVDGKPLTQYMRSNVFLPPDPNNNGRCVYRDQLAVQMKDGDCSMINHYTCEKPLCI